ncbi:S24 family peptidase [Catenovulum sp. 2E275]|uniref:LexA family protein n=1 Tax=Catenovulum sp. 2E275 TaxID=2980497 RepID=UPI0021D11E39|nr:S24 family peptidase [Catenovulum sp. 2E275]MCU4677698.1 S24 family peptidase [Catenovulum sp. 2E275]
MKVIPIFASAGITGFESPAAEYQELGLSLDELLIRNPNATFIGLAKGSSMQEFGIFDGDLLIVDRSETTKDIDVVVANYNGNFCCKILDKVNKLLISSAPDHKPVSILDCDEFQLEGVVIFSVRCHRKPVELLSCML